MYGSLLVPIMKSKLQHELNLILHRRLDVNDVNEVNKVWKMSDMMEELNIDLEAPERIGDQIYKNKWYNQLKGSRLSTEALHVEQGQLWDYCKQKHYSDRCRIVINIEWYGKTRVTSYELRVTSYELKA